MIYIPVNTTAEARDALRTVASINDDRVVALALHGKLGLPFLHGNEEGGDVIDPIDIGAIVGNKDYNTEVRIVGCNQAGGENKSFWDSIAEKFSSLKVIFDTQFSAERPLVRTMHSLDVHH